MNLAQQKIAEKSEQWARTLLTQAAKNEPEITEDLQNIASEVSAAMVGLEHKFKSEESLAKKLAAKVKADLPDLLITGFTEDEEIRKSINLRAVQNNDTLRYTFLFLNENYVFAFKQTLNSLAKRKYKVLEKRIWNAWKNIGTVFDNGYRGINITLISSQKQKFELQFHTKESFDLKTKTHKLYKQIKSNTIPLQRKNGIKEKLVKTAKEIQIPKGIKRL